MQAPWTRPVLSAGAGAAKLVALLCLLVAAPVAAEENLRSSDAADRDGLGLAKQVRLGLREAPTNPDRRRRDPQAF